MNRFRIAVLARPDLSVESRVVSNVLAPHFDLFRMHTFRRRPTERRRARSLVVIGNLPEQMRFTRWSELGIPPPVWIPIGLFRSSDAAGVPDVEVLELYQHERLPAVVAARIIDGLLHACVRGSELTPALYGREELRNLVAKLCGPNPRRTRGSAAAEIGLRRETLNTRWTQLIAKAPGVPELGRLKSGRRTLAVIRGILQDPKARFVPAAKSAGLDPGTARSDLVEWMGKNPSESTLTDLIHGIACIEKEVFGWLVDRAIPDRRADRR